MTEPIADPPSPDRGFTRYQSLLVALLAFVQFTVILDFTIMSPLGAIIMPALDISTGQFGAAVSAYAFSAGISGILSAGFADRFDRKRLLLFFYVGFTLGTALCALAPNYHVLLAGRIVTGLFGGVIGSVVLAITTDLFSLQQRGRVMGFVQTAFAASQVLGIPAGLFLSNHWSWHISFGAIIILSIAGMAAIALLMKPVNAHLLLQQENTAFRHLIATVTQTRYTLAFMVTTLLATGGYMLMPFGSAYTVHNLGIDITHLPTVYLVSGLFSIVTGPLVGRLSDAFGKFPTFAFGSAMSAVMVLIYTHLGQVSLDDGHRRQRTDVRRHLFAHDPVAGADLGDPRSEPARLLQRGQRVAATTLRRPRLGAGGGDHRGKSRWFAPAFRLAGLHRRRDGVCLAGRNVFCAEVRGPPRRPAIRLRRISLRRWGRRRRDFTFALPASAAAEPGYWPSGRDSR